MTGELSGQLEGLSFAERHALERLFRRQIPVEKITTLELAQYMAGLSRSLGRQLGVFANRLGQIEHVIVGDADRLFLPDIGRARAGETRLRGLRLLHTHLRGELITQDDIADLVLLRLDMVAAILVNDAGQAEAICVAHLAAKGKTPEDYTLLPRTPLAELDVDLLALLRDLEATFGRTIDARKVKGDRERAILVHVHWRSQDISAEDSLAELRELADTAGLDVVDEAIQRRAKPDSRFLVGEGKLDEILVNAMKLSVDVLVFDQALSPAQMAQVADKTELRTIDRVQLILDIFARRAKTNDGKVQVELAQLKYRLPRLVRSNEAFSRLAGGIGGRGPGEMKLEIDRRRIRDRISLLERQVDKLGKVRSVQRARRGRNQVPVVAIVGYTNAGKSTLLNTLTRSDVLAESRLFATLDPTRRRLRVADGLEVILTDTVGFIRDMPKDLWAAFQATLEELHEADLLIHVVDAANRQMKHQMDEVERVLDQLQLTEVPTILAFNKRDLVPEAWMSTLCYRYQGVGIAARDKATLAPLLEAVSKSLWNQGTKVPSGGERKRNQQFFTAEEWATERDLCFAKEVTLEADGAAGDPEPGRGEAPT